MVDISDTALVPRELDYRSNDGVEAALVWNQATGHLWVSVNDSRTDESFRLDVEAHYAVDAFNHSSAYAARRGVDYREPLRV